ncbi:MAG: iron-containing alcohol dehydrogenase [Anaerolineales bacterium]|nr:iron-containing alcohol dehydrogenase [Anaerolineales bacterium]
MRIWNLPVTDYRPFSAIEEQRDVVVVMSEPAWTAVSSHLSHLSITSVVEARDATISHWDTLLPQCHGDVVYAVGGGLAVDAAKYIAVKQNKPLVCLPTALSVDAFLTWASGYRHDGCVYYLETKPPDALIIDLAVLAAAPTAVRAAGICDLLSIATGCWDWQFAHEQGQNPAHAPFIPYVYQAAQAILQGSLDCAEAAGRGDPDGLKQLLDCLALEVQLCNQIGHSRPEEGSEHYFAYAVENVMGKGLPHGDLVGPGIVLMAEKQGQDTAPLLRALDACHIPLGNIPETAVIQTLSILPTYVRQHRLPYGIAHQL